jgi:glyoxylase-like metal-dependent hydrolase (beta-lactamase superfamily II)
MAMIRLQHIVLSCLLIAGTGFHSARAAEPGAAPVPATVDMEVKRVSEHVYYVEGRPGMASENQGFISNAGFVVTGAGVVVIDALGTPALAELLLEKIRGVTDQPVVRVIATHYHADHIYGLQVFAALDAEILAPAGADEYLASSAAQERLEERRFSLDPWVNENTHLVPPDRLLEEGIRFRLGDVEFVVTVVGAAHSRGDLMVYVLPDGVLFSGDVIFEGRVPFLGDADTRLWLELLQRLENQKLVALIPGHGAAASDPDQAIALTRRYLTYLRQSMASAVENLVPFSEAYANTDWSGFEDLPAFEAANRRNAYQVYLSLEAEMLGD